MGAAAAAVAAAGGGIEADGKYIAVAALEPVVAGGGGVVHGSADLMRTVLSSHGPALSVCITP